MHNFALYLVAVIFILYLCECAIFFFNLCHMESELSEISLLVVSLLSRNYHHCKHTLFLAYAH